MKGEVIAPSKSSATATPQGFACFTITQARFLKSFDAFQRSIGIGYVVIGKRFSLQLLCAADALGLPRLFVKLRSGVGFLRSASLALS